MRLESLGLFTITLMLTAFGVIMIYDTSALRGAEQFGDSYFFIKRAGIRMIIGFSLLALGATIDYHFWLRYRKWILLATIALLVIVLIPGVAPEIMGARRWLRIGPLSLQPSEIAKVTLVMFLAGYCAMKDDLINDPKTGVAPAFLVLGTVVTLVVLEKDLGTPIAMMLIAMGLLFVGGMRLRYLLGLVSVGVVGAIGLIAMEPYRVKRILVFLNPWEDPQGAGWHVVQSLLAFGAGGVTGVGWGQGLQKLYYLPEAHTDFVFAIIAEESGLVGTTIVTLLFALFAGLGTKIALRAEDRGGAFLAMGLTLTIVAGAGINIAVVTGLVPTKGIPLPFISYGGSALMMSLFSVGILMNLALSIRQPIAAARAECV